MTNNKKMKGVDKKDISNFFKGNKIAKETIDLLKNGIHSDKKNLGEYIITNSYAKNIINRLTDVGEINKLRSSNERGNCFESLKSLEDKMQNHQALRRRNRVITYSLLSVASVIAVLFFFINIPNEYKTEETIALVQQDSEISVPTLISNEGNNISLIDKNIQLENAQLVGDTKIAYIKNQQLVSETVQYNILVIPSKYSYTIILEDSTEVFLNAGSELRYPINFIGDKREVFLKGEGYFKVKKGQIPFIVVTSDISVKVYGTEFNINTNKKDLVETVLVSGSVGVTMKNSTAKELFIKPNQIFSFNRMNGVNSIENIDVTNYIAWINDQFKCDAEKLSVMLDRIALWYGVEFEYLNSNIGNVEIDINLSRKTELDNILRALEKISGASIIKKDLNKYVVK